MPKYLYGKDPVELNANRTKLTLDVTNTGDRAVQVGSHYHFFEVNPALQFDRDRTLGMHLNIAAGTAVRFEPGERHRVELCTFGGTGRFIGFSGLLDGSVISHPVRVRAVQEALEEGFKGAETTEPKHAIKPKARAKATSRSKAAAKATSKRGAS